MAPPTPDLCTSKSLPNPTYEVYEHSGGSAQDGSGGSMDGAEYQLQCWYSCIVTVDGKEYETSYVYKTEENAKEKAAKKAWEAVNSGR